MPALWDGKDGATALSNGAVFAAADLGSLVVSAPDNGGETASLTLTVSSSRGFGGDERDPRHGGDGDGGCRGADLGGPAGQDRSEEPGSALTLTGVTVSGDATTR